MALFTQVAEFYGNFDPLVARVQKMLEEASTVEKNQVSQYLGNLLSFGTVKAKKREGNNNEQ
jgi:hypothetical protein